MTNPKPHNKTSDWLLEQQLRSWEPEILLSGIVLYGMFQLPDILDQFVFFFEANIFNSVNSVDILVAVLKMGIYWLIAGLISHLFCRGLWVGLIGLSYSYPEGIKIFKLKYRATYRRRIQTIPSFEKIILKLEIFSSTIYSISFLLFMALVSVYTYIFILFFGPLMIVFIVGDSLLLNDVFNKLVGVYAVIVSLIGVVGLIDFLTVGYFRRSKIFSKLYWPFYLIFSYTTLGKFYRPIYYAITTNVNRRLVIMFFILFVIINWNVVGALQIGSSADKKFSRIDVWSNENGVVADERFYQDSNSDHPSTQVQISSDVIKDDVLKVFLPANIGLQDSMKSFINYDSIKAVSGDVKEEGQYLLEGIGTFYILSIGDSILKSQFYFQNRSTISQKGYITYLDIGYLSKGLYELRISGPDRMYKEPFATVPFYKLDQ